MKKKKIMTILFGAAICASLALTACGESGSSGRGTRPRQEEEDDEDDEEEDEEQKETPDEDKPENGGDAKENENTGGDSGSGREDAGNGSAGANTQPAVEYTGMDFKTTDLDGNQISARDLFSAHEYTMVNVWASWCGPCVSEIPDLAEINESWAEKDCAIVGLLLDGSDPYGLQDGKEILRNAGADYLNLIPTADMERIFSVEVVPTSFFVDRSGNIVGDTIEGAWPEGYEMTINELLGK